MAVAAPFVAWLAFMAWLGRYAWRRTASGVTSALRRRGEVTVRVGWLGNAWNPAKPLGVDNPIFDPGLGTYRMHGDEVVLTWQPKHGSGTEYRGTIPDRLKNKQHPERRRVRRAAWIVVGVEVAAAAGGCAVGFLMSSGTTGERLLFAMLGMAGGMAVIWFVLLVANVSVGVRKALRPHPGASH